MDQRLLETIEVFQKTETTEHYVYSRLAELVEGNNREVLLRIAGEEGHHAEVWSRYTGKTFRPNRLKAFFYLFIARIFSYTFAIKLMERGEERAEAGYGTLVTTVPEAEEILHEEEEHEKELTAMLDEERLGYIGSMVLGLNDALVELTGALAGLTFALQHTRLVGLTGLITGISAALSMAASEYLSTRSEKGEKSPGKAALYTGVVYLVTVLILVWPYFVLGHYVPALAFALLGAVTVILIFTFFVSVVQEESFARLFLEMLGVSLGVAALSFGIGLLARMVLKVDI
ncbi:protein of unknown function DUF125 transmembrane [Spirochaeta thermophila DSM 6578]|uniref:Rubrerythrin diiron-binding domain-containing protein n=1 Tax=Winmispira thermophila (strain ATCC 700085 / DSM 6578 / Z-1203) TaxID=869211 RepID=G0GCK6_WINT7|nr:VIT1/CCC1 transporter family protein [Spirochaeta thermophila]AEJ62072.1 protein of unknown function DUF125 transmembrane [Spirochaeta thermophila DSM 6578]